MTTTETTPTTPAKGGTTSSSTKPNPVKPAIPKGRLRVAPTVVGGATIAAAIAAVQIAATYGPTAGITASGAFLLLILGAWFAYKAYRRRLQRTGKKPDKEPTGRGAKPPRGHARFAFGENTRTQSPRKLAADLARGLNTNPASRGRSTGGRGSGQSYGTTRNQSGRPNGNKRTNRLRSLLPGNGNRGPGNKVAGHDRTTTGARSEGGPTNRRNTGRNTGSNARNVAGHPTGSNKTNKTNGGGPLRNLASRIAGHRGPSKPKHSSPVSQHRANTRGSSHSRGGSTPGSSKNTNSHGAGRRVGDAVRAAGRGATAAGRSAARVFTGDKPRRAAGTSDYRVRYNDGTLSPDRRPVRKRVAGWTRDRWNNAAGRIGDNVRGHGSGATTKALSTPLEGITKDTIRSDAKRWADRMAARWEAREATRNTTPVKYKDTTVPTPNHLDTPAKRWADAERAESGKPKKQPVPPRNAVPNFARGPVKPLPARNPTEWANKPTTQKASERKMPDVSVTFPGKDTNSMSVFDGFNAEDASPQQVSQMMQQTPDELRATARGMASIATNAEGSAFKGVDESYRDIAQALYSVAMRAEENATDFQAKNAVGFEFQEEMAGKVGAANWAKQD